MKTIIVPDPHLGGASVLGKPNAGSQLNSRVIDQFNLLNFILEQALINEVSTIIVSGDIFDDPKPISAIIVLFIEWLRKCSDADITVHLILGNHDLLRSGQQQMSALDIIAAAEIDNVFVHKTINTLHFDGISFTLMPFRDRRSFNVASHDEAIGILSNKLPYELAEINRNNMKIVVGHLALHGSIPALNEIDDTINELFCPIEMFVGYDQVIMGHIHKFQHITKSHGHIGSLDISNFGEKDQDKYIAIIDPNAAISCKYIELPTRKLNQISISVPVDISDTTSYVLNELKNNTKNFSKSIAQVNISLGDKDMINIDRPVIEKWLNDQGVFHISKITEERKISRIMKTASLKELDSTVNEQAAIRMYADATIDEIIKDEFIMLANDIVKECMI